MIAQFRLSVVGLVIVALLVAAAACGDDDDNGGGDVSAQLDSIEQSIDELVESSRRGQVLATMTTIRTEGLHDIDDEAQQASEIQAGWDGAITRMGQAVGGTNWPDELSTDAADLHEKLTAAEDAISSGDLAESKTAISFAHAAWHDIEHAAFQYIGGEEVTGDDDEHEDGDTDGGGDDHDE